MKSELLISLSLIPFIVCGGVLGVFFFHNATKIEYNNIPFYIPFGSMVAGLGFGLPFINFLGKKISSLWKMELIDQNLSIDFKGKHWQFGLDEVEKLKIYGNSKFKYVSFWIDKAEPIRMRIGNSGLTAFSNRGDLETLDEFLKNIQRHFEKKYIKIDKLKTISPAGTVKLTYLKK